MAMVVVYRTEWFHMTGIPYKESMVVVMYTTGLVNIVSGSEF
jgi:lipid A disaccharide synthetase